MDNDDNPNEGKFVAMFLIAFIVGLSAMLIALNILLPTLVDAIR